MSRNAGKKYNALTQYPETLFPVTAEQYPDVSSLSTATSYTNNTQHEYRSISPVSTQTNGDKRGPATAQACSSTHNSSQNTTPKCFRISNVPLDWRKDKLLEALKGIDPLLEPDPQLSLYPACCGDTQTALLSLRICTIYFQCLKSNDSNYVTTLDGILVIDSHFYDLTPLNTLEKEIVAESVPIIPDLASANIRQYCGCDWPRRACIRFMEESRNSPNVVERFSAARYQEYSYHDLRL
jgi:hypothetical protein